MFGKLPSLPAWHSTAVLIMKIDWWNGLSCFFWVISEKYLANVGYTLFQCLSSTVGFGFGCSYIARYEVQGVGSQWSNIYSSPIPEDEFSLSSCMWMMIFDSAIYLLITWYVEAVFPGWFATFSVHLLWVWDVRSEHYHRWLIFWNVDW